MKGFIKHKKGHIFFFLLILILSLGWLPQLKKAPDAPLKHMVVGRSNDSISLDPAIAIDSESVQVTANIFETLVRYEKGGDAPIPSLAESWRTSEDGLTWHFKIREQVKFHDGTDLNAQAIAFNFHRWMDLESPYHTGQFSYWNYSFGSNPGIIKSVSALSETTLEIVLNEPYAPFLSVLSLPAFGIASPDAIVRYNETLKKNPIGTGPFKFVKWDEGSAILLERFDQYWQSPAKLNLLEFRVLTNKKDALDLLHSGEIHLIDSLDWETVDALDQDPEINLHYRPFFNIGYLALNHQVEPFDQYEVRKAVSLLIDREMMIDQVFTPLARPALTFLPPLISGYHEGIPLQSQNVEEAKALLAKAGFENGFETTLWVMTSPRNYFQNPIEVAYFIKRQLELGDIIVHVKPIRWDAFMEQIKEGKHPMALSGWNGDTIDPDNFLYTLFHSENTKPELAMNYTFYNNNTVDHLLIQARRATNFDFRISLYREIQEILFKEVVSIPLVHTMTVIGTHKSIVGFQPDIAGQEWYRNVDMVGPKN